MLICQLSVYMKAKCFNSQFYVVVYICEFTLIHRIGDKF